MPGGAEVHGSSNGVSNGAASATPKGAARFDASRLALLKSRLGEFVERGDLPGLSFVLGCDGEDVMRECIGMFDVEKKVPLTEDAIFRGLTNRELLCCLWLVPLPRYIIIRSLFLGVMSMTKPIAAVAIMMLVEEARFSLNTPVSTFIPEFATLKVFVKENADGSIETEPLKEPMTIRHLITHTSWYLISRLGGRRARCAFLFPSTYAFLLVYKKTNGQMELRLDIYPWNLLIGCTTSTGPKRLPSLGDPKREPTSWRIFVRSLWHSSPGPDGSEHFE